MCGVAFDDERWSLSGNETSQMIENDYSRWENIQQSTRGGGADGMQGGVGTEVRTR
jgi:hypothetical protein